MNGSSYSLISYGDPLFFLFFSFQEVGAYPMPNRVGTTDLIHGDYYLPVS